VVTDVVQDGSYPAPCNMRVGWAQYIDTCPICRPRSSEKSENEKRDVYSEESGENQDIDLIIYPNPSDDFIRLKSKKPILSYSIFNSAGQLSAFYTYRSDDVTAAEIDVSDLKVGQYIVNILTIENKLLSKKIIVK
jgi:hypothetical protein